MDKTLAGLIGAAGALAAATSAQAAGVANPGLTDVMHAASYADLLKPIPNAAALLQATDATPAVATEAGESGKVLEIQYYYHHHHHHHRYYRRPVYHHHHHHHHHRGREIVIPLPR